MGTKGYRERSHLMPNRVGMRHRTSESVRIRAGVKNSPAQRTNGSTHIYIGLSEGACRRFGEGSDVQNSELAESRYSNWNTFPPPILNSVRLSLACLAARNCLVEPGWT